MRPERRLPSRPAIAVALLMVLQVAGCTVVGWGEPLLPIFCTAAAPEWDWLGSIMAVLLVGFIPFALASFAFRPIRYAAIAVGVAALSGLILQHILLANGTFHCDAP
jgi:hypothetical protein